jgi:hypothetical protein
VRGGREPADRGTRRGLLGQDGPSPSPPAAAPRCTRARGCSRTRYRPDHAATSECRYHGIGSRGHSPADLPPSPARPLGRGAARAAIGMAFALATVRWVDVTSRSTGDSSRPYRRCARLAWLPAENASARFVSNPSRCARPAADPARRASVALAAPGSRRFKCAIVSQRRRHGISGGASAGTFTCSALPAGAFSLHEQPLCPA